MYNFLSPKKTMKYHISSFIVFCVFEYAIFFFLLVQNFECKLNVKQYCISNA
jgi:hypothetical protein